MSSPQLSSARAIAPSRQSAGALRATIEILAAAGLMALAAQVAIPVPGTPVPMTLQSLVMLLAGLMLSPGRAAAAMVAYLGLGSAYAPCFAAGSHGLSGYTGGYLVGFVAGAWLTSVVRGPAASTGRMVVAGLVGSAALFALGVVWQSAYLGGNLGDAVAKGFVPFVVKDFVQLAAAVALVKVVRVRAAHCETSAGRLGCRPRNE